MELDLPERGKSSPLPPYRGVLAVDMENFSRTSGRDQQVIGALIPNLLENALSRSDLAHVWRDRRFARHGGDGYVFGTEPEHLPYLVSPFLDNLQEKLEEIQPHLAHLDRGLRMRLRVSIDVGPLPDLGEGSPVNAMGEAMISTHRLLDAEPVREELRRTDPDTTLVAVIISRRVYEDVVLGGFTPIRPSRWRQVNATVGGKSFQAEGYLYVPTPSWGTDPGENGERRAERSGDGGAPDRGTGGAAEPGPEEAPAAPNGPRTVQRIDTNHGQAVQLGSNHGDINLGGLRRDR
ncbi:MULTISPECIES: hypothetical protein [unclassified Nocardiopsis]|uniref:hypothetical protein n=1 Tax=unclassified Nocardiopsis TaxID=2649073 RepID=UPI0033C70AA1